MALQRGQIVYVCIGEGVGHEQRGGRPGLIVSDDALNSTSPCVTVCWITTAEKTTLPSHVPIDCLREPSTVLCETVTTIDVRRTRNIITKLSEEDMNRVDEALARAIGLKDK